MKRAPLRSVTGGQYSSEYIAYVIEQPGHDFIEPDGNNDYIYAAYNDNGVYKRANNTTNLATCVVYNIEEEAFDVCVGGKLALEKELVPFFVAGLSYSSDAFGHIVESTSNNINTNIIFDCVQISGTIAFIELKTYRGRDTGGGAISVVDSLTGIDKVVNKIIFNGTSEQTLFTDNIVTINYPPPPLLNSIFTLVGSTKYTGRVSQSNINYKTIAGAISNDIIKDANLQLIKTNVAMGSVGILKVSINGILKAEYDLGINFNEANRAGLQDITNDYSNSGITSINTGGALIIDEVGSTGHVYSDLYQHLNFTIMLTPNDIRVGYNQITIEHNGNIGIVELFYDTNTGVDPYIDNVVITEVAPIFNFLSGIHYYDLGSSFGIDLIAHACFDNVYAGDNAPVRLTTPWNVQDILYNDAHVTGVSVVPDITEIMTVTSYPLVIPNNFLGGSNLATTVTPKDPYNTYSPVTITNGLLSKPNVITSTFRYEGFTDELWRFPLTTNFNIVPPVLTGNWDSTLPLTISDLQVYDINAPLIQTVLKYPDTDYSLSMPINNPNYTAIGLGVNASYVRLTRSSKKRSNGRIAVPGLTNADFISGDVIILIKVPSKTVWLDVWKDWIQNNWNNDADINGGIDFTGCRIDPNKHSPDIDGELSFTLKNFKVDNNVNRCMFVKIIYKNKNIPKLLEAGMDLVKW